MSETLKTPRILIKIGAILAIVIGVLECITIILSILGIPTLIGGILTLRLCNKDDRELKEKNVQFLVWGIVFLLISGLVNGILLIVAYILIEQAQLQPYMGQYANPAFATAPQQTTYPSQPSTPAQQFNIVIDTPNGTTISTDTTQQGNTTIHVTEASTQEQAQNQQNFSTTETPEQEQAAKPIIVETPSAVQEQQENNTPNNVS